MSAKSMSETYLDLARAMIKQARMLKMEGLKAEARDLARRAIEMKGVGWGIRPAPALVRIKR